MSAIISLLYLVCIPALVVANLPSALTGHGFDVVFPNSAGYPNACKAFNLRFTFQPAAIAYPSCPEHISEIVKISSQYNYFVVARSGGHSYIANGLGGKSGVIVVDLSKLIKVTVDASSGTAVIETGNSLGEVALALNAHGRALPHGTCPYVGIGGHSGYGGYGFTSRKWGLTLDTIISLDLVLANGTITTASSSKNSDLYWALRGASGSYGIVTSIKVNTFAAPPSATVFEYKWNVNVPDAARIVTGFQNYIQTNIPQEFAAEIVLSKGQDKGNISLGLTGGYYGPASNVNATLAPLFKGLPVPQSTKLTVGSYIKSVQYLGGGDPLDTRSKPDGHDTFYAKSLMTPESSPMTQKAIAAFMSYLANDGHTTDLAWFVEIELYGGHNSAINNVPLGASAFAHRNSMFTIQFYASSPNMLPPFPDYGFDFLDDMVNSIIANSLDNWDYGAYPNYVDDKLSNWQQLYYGTHYARLKKLKDIYDPKATFSFPTGIEG